jgi:predicted RecB family nuclease
LILEEQDIELVFGEDIETRDDLEEMGLTEVMELV